jgi:hypothetical protein
MSDGRIALWWRSFSALPARSRSRWFRLSSRQGHTPGISDSADAYVC